MSYQTDEAQVRRRFFWRTLCLVLAFLLAAAVLVPATAGFARRAKARVVFREAKNVVLSLRLLSLQYGAQQLELTDGRADDGLADGAADRVRETSGADGEVRVLAWDALYGRPVRLLYTRSRIQVLYTWDAAQDTEHWQVSFLEPLFSF